MDDRRRHFLRWAGAASAAPVAAVAAFQPATRETVTPMPLMRQHFAPLEGHEFAFETSPLESVRARLSAVQLPPAPALQDGRSFVLRFEVAPGSLAARTYTASHPALGRFALFVSPVDADGRHVEAVFNRA
jgi:hypothetical protein